MRDWRVGGTEAIETYRAIVAAEQEAVASSLKRPRNNGSRALGRHGMDLMYQQEKKTPKAQRKMQLSRSRTIKGAGSSMLHSKSMPAPVPPSDSRNVPRSVYHAHSAGPETGSGGGALG